MPPSPETRIGHALSHEMAPAFHLLLRHLDHRERHDRVARALDLIRAGRMNTQGIFVLRGPDALVGVIVGEPVAGAGAILWPPVVADPQRQDFEDLLVQHACAWLRQSARLAQCLLPPEEKFLAVPLLRNGFQLITSLSYLRHDLQPTGTHSDPARLAFEPYDQDSPALFHETLVRTYENTLDCPEVNGVRTVEEVIQGHRAQGEFDPNLWWLASAGAPAGVLMVNVVNPGEEWEVGYMGIVPEARRCGFGIAMLRKALDEARARQVRRITLCVDDRNVPAWNLYRRMGFTSFDQRMVFLAVWQRAG